MTPRHKYRPGRVIREKVLIFHLQGPQYVIMISWNGRKKTDYNFSPAKERSYTMKKIIRRHVPVGLLFILMAGLLCSCASSDRALRISPFSNAEAMSADRVNLWPLAYHDSEATSILWPVIDVDDQGFAVRPLFNKDAHNYSILFPLCAWNPKRHDGWLGTAYWDSGEYGMFPVFHKGNQFKYVGPFWWSERKDTVKSAGVFPLMAWTRDQGHWLFPLYRWQNWRDNGNRLTLGLGALAFVEETPGHSTFYVLPTGTFLNTYYSKEGAEKMRKLQRKDNYYLWGTQRFFTTAESTSWHTWPLAGVIRHPRDTFSDPLFNTNLINSYRHGDESSFFFTPLWGKSQTKEGAVTRALPLYYRKKNDDRSSTNVLLLAGHRQSPDWSEWYLLPLVNRLSGTDHPASASLNSYLAFYSSANTPQRDYLRLGWGFLYSHGKEIKETGTRKETSLLTLYRRDTYQASDETLESLDNAAFYQWSSPRRLLSRDAVKLLPVVLTERSTYKQETRPLLARNLFDSWRDRLLHSRKNDSREKQDALKSRLRACLETDPEATAILDRLNPNMPPKEKVAVAQEAMTAYSRNKTVLSRQSSFHIPFVFKREESPNRKETSVFVLVKNQSYTQKEDVLIDQWLHWNWSQKNVGRIQSKSLSFFPLWFHHEATDLRLAHWDDKLLKAMGNWREADVALPRNHWNIPASGPDTFSARQKELMNVLKRYPELSDEVNRAAAADDVDTQAIILYQAVKKLAKTKIETRQSSGTHIPLIFKSSHRTDRSHWSFLLGIANGQRQGDDTKLSVLRYLYRREKTPARVYRDFFPFFTWNSTTKTAGKPTGEQVKNSDFSFLWHVLHLRKENGKRSGHLLFIPFGK